MNFKHTLIAAGMGLALAAPQAQATLYDFSYTGSWGNLSGVMDGTLQSDGNRVVVNSIQDFVTINGVAGPSLSFLVAEDAAIGFNPAALPTVSLDGSFMDFSASTDSSGTNGFGIVAGDFFDLVAFGGTPMMGGGGAFPGVTAQFDATAWNMHAAVPLPGTLSLLAIGGLGFLRRRQGMPV